MLNFRVLMASQQRHGTQRETRKIFILSGGAGTRLWPLSREAFPKQFYDLAQSGRPLLIDTCERLKSFGDLSIITTEALRFSTVGILNRYQVKASVVSEPVPRNTAPAVALATLISLREDPESVVGIFPADHVIQNQAAFQAALDTALQVASRDQVVVTIGIQPSGPSTAYGYMNLEGAVSYAGAPRPVKVLSFTEKPNPQKAQELLSTQRAVWNAGIFVFSAKTMAALFAEHMPLLWEKLSSLDEKLSRLPELYPQLESKSIDYGVMEKLGGKLLCVPTEFGWSDIGSWEEVARRSHSLSQPVEVDAHDNHYTGLVSPTKTVAFVGVSDTVVVDTEDALLVMKKGSGQKVREVVEDLKRQGAVTKLHSHVFEERPWGRFEVLMETPQFKSKRILVWPGHKLSYQSHEKRSEHWVVVKGVAQVTLNGEVRELHPGEHVHIPQGTKHRIGNSGSDVVEFIEVQTGSYFGEDDIKRYSDDYGRT